MLFRSSVTLTANGANSYSWSQGSTNPTVSLTPSLTSNYTVIGKSNAGCTGNSTTITVTVYNLPTVTIIGSSTLCAGDNITLTANGANTYTWINGSNSQSLFLSPNSNTVITLNGSNTFGCQNLNTATLNLTLINRPQISISGTNALCAGQNIVLTANGASSYTWSNKIGRAHV